MRYIARQPIFDPLENAVAYELVFRRSRENVVQTDDPDKATKAAIDAALLVGLDVFANGKRIFIHCTRESLIKGYATLFPSGSTVLDIADSVVADEQITAACTSLKESGYGIAIGSQRVETKDALAEMADILKVDLDAVSKQQKRASTRKMRGKSPMAVKVETPQEFETAKRLGFSLFQGSFFAKPTVLSAREVTGSRMTHLRLMQAISAPQANLNELDRLIKSEPALCYRFLRYMNSPLFALRGQITSIVQALTLLGEQEFRKWMTITCTALASDNKPAELVTTALIRARFCELLAANANCPPPSAFILGLFSLMDAILDAPMQHVISLVALPEGVSEALLGRPNRLRNVLDVALAYESANWAGLSGDPMRCCNEDETAARYVEALAWNKGLVSS